MENLAGDLDSLSDCIRVPDVANKLDVDVVKGLVLARYTLSQNVVYEPSKINVFLLGKLFAFFRLILRSICNRSFTLFLSFSDHKLFDSL